MKQYTVQWANNVTVGHGNIGAGVDWQKQSTAPGTAYVKDGYDQLNTGIYLTGLQQVGDLRLKAQPAATITHSLVVMEPGKRVPVGNSSKAIVLSLLMARRTRHLILATVWFLRKSESEILRKSKQWEGAFEGLTAGVNWRISGYRNRCQ
ncbi:vitamin B12/cobalamin outer membrane transporter [Escherichia coli]|uniref:Vitamin B12/cobalamin outer membrane transporter n=1 Tax=Escherichia coli TaxID=562 RepID=A0A485JLN6_ECOLX|nr:vitamin B12/cobalamin outer membrane transporter [Escherichia coli]